MLSGHCQPGEINDLDTVSEPVDLSAVAIPDFTHTWESQGALSVRRPSSPPDPETYHELIEPGAIFEIDEIQKDSSIETILVVPFSCKRCRNLKQACSRLWPACVRCRKAGSTQCDPIQQGYQRLPGPKYSRSSTSVVGKQSNVSSDSSPPIVQQTVSGRALRARRTAPSISQPPLTNGAPITSGSKRSRSYDSDYAPPKRKLLTSGKIPPQKRRGRPPRVPMVEPAEETDMENSESMRAASVQDSTYRESALRWTFVRNLHSRDKESLQGPEDVRSESTQPNTLTPRVWTKSLDILLTVFPELGKTTVGFSWFQSEIPILLLDSDRARGRWTNSTTLDIDLIWDFLCHDFELEFSAEPPIGDFVRFQIHPHSAAPHMSLQYPHAILSTSLYPHEAVFAPPETFDALTSSAEKGSLYPSQPVPPSQNSSAAYPYPVFDEPLTPLSTPPANFRQCIPLSKPPEVEALLDSQHRSIPLLLWVQHDSELVPCGISSEYSYSCMGLFFVSNLRHTVIQPGVFSAPGLVQGRVCWSVTLQWAPGGEEALSSSDASPSSDVMPDATSLQTVKDLSHPWWFNPTSALSLAGSNTPRRPRDLRMQYFSYIPLDLLADFHPSESFPRAWFCKLCGLINSQLFFRHQICQSTMCASVNRGVSQGKMDSLSSLRDPYQSSSLIRPTNHIPSVVESDSVTWDDGMQCWIYAVNGGVSLRHVFTGNQEHLQEDATVLLERIQCEVLLRKEDNSSPYFTHVTKFSYQSDESEATVPTGTPDPIRMAYYSLCDLVQRYGEMEKPRFGEVRMQAWVHSGSKKGAVFRAHNSPVVVYCLGAEVVLAFTPKGGYGYKNINVELTRQDKGKERAGNEDRTGSPLAEPRAGPSHRSERNGHDKTLIFRPDANESPILAENADEAAAAMDTTRQRRSFDAGDVVPSHLSTFHPGMKVAHHEVAEPKQERVRKKIKVIKDKNKASVPEISMTLLHGDCVVLSGDDFECQIVRTGTTILVIGIPEETRGLLPNDT